VQCRCPEREIAPIDRELRDVEGLSIAEIAAS